MEGEDDSSEEEDDEDGEDEDEGDEEMEEVGGGWTFEREQRTLASEEEGAGRKGKGGSYRKWCGEERNRNGIFVIKLLTQCIGWEEGGWGVYDGGRAKLYGVDVV